MLHLKQIAIKLIAARAYFKTANGLFLIIFLPSVAQANLRIEHWTHTSGAQVYLAASPAIPMVDVQIDWDAGSRRDLPKQAGLAATVAAQIDKGVAAQNSKPANAASSAADKQTALDENALGEAWADLGASFNAGAGTDRFSASLRSLTYPDLLGKAALLASRILAAPSFNANVWQRDRARWVASIKEANTRPATIALRNFNRAVYGTHSYGFEPTEATLDAIDVKDLRAFHQQYLLPCRAKVNIVGALDRAKADALVSQLFGGFNGTNNTACPALPALADVQPLQEAKDIKLPFDAAQAHVFIGQPGYKRSDPDFFALMVGNYLLGDGGFVSRLSSEVREKRGLSYSVYSYFSPGLHAGAFTIGLQTRPDQAAQAVQVSREVLNTFVKDGPSEAELKAAKDFLINGFALRLDSNRKLLDNVANISWNNLPLNYLDTWTQQIEKVSAEQVKAAFQRKLQPQRMVTVVVGGAP
jgi:zinc protease